MVKKPIDSRKLFEFDAQTWHALNLLSRELPMRHSAICCKSRDGRPI